MERKTNNEGSEVLFLDKFQLVYIQASEISPVNFRFAIRGEYPLDNEGREAYKNMLITDMADYFLAQGLEFLIDFEELSAKSLIVFGGVFPEHKQAELEKDYTAKNRIFIDTDEPQRAALLDWFHGAIFIPTYE